MKFEIPFLKGVERRVIIVTIALFVSIFIGSAGGDIIRNLEPDYRFALINAVFISLSVGVVMHIVKTRDQDNKKKTHREIKEKQKRKK